MKIDNLIIEVTRRCNLSCAHCLRGDTENVDMPRKYLEELFSKVDEVYMITLTGGEPSLCPAKIMEILEVAEKYKVPIDGFYIATNGMEVSDEFLLAVMRLAVYCGDLNEVSALEFSNDPYHEEVPDENLRRLKVFSFFGLKYSDRFDGTNLLGEGRADGMGVRSPRRDAYEIEDDYEGAAMVRDGAVYLNCEGNIISGCDWSYESQREPENIVCPVTKLSLQSLAEFNKRRE